MSSEDKNDLIDPQIRNVKERYRYELLLKAQVQGIGLGTQKTNGVDTGIPCIIVYVYPKLPRGVVGPRDLVPPALDDVLTDVVETPPAKPLIRTTSTVAEPERTRRWRPAPAGVSVGHYQLKGAGTLGAWVQSKETGELFLLSCWHVLTNYGKGRQGDPILQPGLIDGGSVEKDTIAWLEKWVDVRMLGPSLGEAKSNLKSLLDRGKTLPLNYIDAAIAKPVSEEVVSYEVLGIGKMKGVARTTRLGEEMVSSGRTSGVTRSYVSALDVDMFIGYPTGVALFLDSVATSPKTTVTHFHPCPWVSGDVSTWIKALRQLRGSNAINALGRNLTFFADENHLA